MKLPGLTYTSPTGFRLKERLVLATVPAALAWCMRALAGSCRLDLRNAEYLDEATAAGPVILAFWHETLALAAYHYRNTGYHTLTSYSFDGELAARFVQRFGLPALRGSSSRGGMRALIELEKALTAVTVGITVDGPKGPRREAKPGAAILAARSGRPIVPVAFAMQRAWRMNSWDRLIIPKPFATIVCAYAPPIPPPAAASAEGIEQTRRALEDTLNRLHAAIEARPAPAA